MGVVRKARFRNSRERALWLVILAGAAGAGWAVALALQWSGPVRAVLAAVAAVAVVLIPEVRARLARTDAREHLLGRLEAHGKGVDLPRVRDLDLGQLRVHASRAVVPYIRRDAEGVVETALLRQHPLLIVGHSMAGKTRLAAECLIRLLPDARMLAPAPGASLRDLVIASGLDVNGLVIWLDDIERFFRGDSALDVGLLERLMRDGAVVVATIRLSQFSIYRPRDNARPPEWEVLRRFERITLSRKNTDTERERIQAAVHDPVILEGVGRYGLAEYLGAGPDAIERYDDGETTCPVGHALVRVAVDSRRAGLGQYISLDDLKAAVPIYLAERPEILCDNPAIENGLQWATERINETVALLLPHRQQEIGSDHAERRVYEVFDYLVDVVGGRAGSQIPFDMWRRVGEVAGSEAREVARAAGSYFSGRAAVMAELVSWLVDSSAVRPLLVLTGDPGTGKTAVLTALALLSAPQTDNLVRTEIQRQQVRIPPIDVQMTIRHLTESEFLQRLCVSLGLSASEATSLATAVEAVERVAASLNRPLTAIVDGLDESMEPVEVASTIQRLVWAGAGRSNRNAIRVLVSTRRQFVQEFTIDNGMIIDLNDPRFDDPGALVDLARQILSAPGSVYEAESSELIDRVADAVAARSSGTISLHQVRRTCPCQRFSGA